MKLSVKQSRIAAMKTMLISATSAIFILGTAFAHEITVSPVVPLHVPIVERRAAQLNSGDGENGVLCRTKYITTKSGDEDRTTRKSVDCEE
jgi:hypothetical protein